MTMQHGSKKITFEQKKVLEQRLKRDLEQQLDGRWKYKPAKDGSIQSDATVGNSLGCSPSAVAKMRNHYFPGGFVTQFYQPRIQEPEAPTPAPVADADLWWRVETIADFVNELARAIGREPLPTLDEIRNAIR